MEQVSLFETAFGAGAVVASEKGICRVLLPGEGAVQSYERIAASNPVPSGLTERAALKLTSYFKGEQQTFDDLPVDLRGLSSFRARILHLIRAIPYGAVRSYGEVAAMAGVPGAARAIGGAMASNPVPIIIPCHRVVAANGRLTGYSAPGGVAVKKILLQMEHVEFKGEGVRLEHESYKQGKIGMKIN
jgi:methylated-DNA-[protein]-cysteine S-methyltransferase